MNVHIRVVCPVIPTGLTQASDFDGILGSVDRLSYVEIEQGPSSIECEFDKMLAVTATVGKIAEAAEEGVDAVVIDCMCDPGLQAGRQCVNIPVLGPCETSMSLACTLGHRFSVIAVSSQMRSMFETQAKIYGAWEKYASTRSVEVPVVDLSSRSEQLRSALFEQASLALQNDGADVIILGCTGMVGVAKTLQDDLLKAGFPVPVIDPMPTTVRIAKVLVESGICHSKLASPAPGIKPVNGFNALGLEKFIE